MFPLRRNTFLPLVVPFSPIKPDREDDFENLNSSTIVFVGSREGQDLPVLPLRRSRVRTHSVLVVSITAFGTIILISSGSATNSGFSTIISTGFGSTTSSGFGTIISTGSSSTSTSTSGFYLHEFSPFNSEVNPCDHFRFPFESKVAKISYFRGFM